MINIIFIWFSIIIMYYFFTRLLLWFIDLLLIDMILFMFIAYLLSFIVIFNYWSLYWRLQLCIGIVIDSQVQKKTWRILRSQLNYRSKRTLFKILLILHFFGHILEYEIVRKYFKKQLTYYYVLKFISVFK